MAINSSNIHKAGAHCAVPSLPYYNTSQNHRFNPLFMLLRYYVSFQYSENDGNKGRKEGNKVFFNFNMVLNFNPHESYTVAEMSEGFDLI